MFLTMIDIPSSDEHVKVRWKRDIDLTFYLACRRTKERDSQLPYDR